MEGHKLCYDSIEQQTELEWWIMAKALLEDYRKRVIAAHYDARELAKFHGKSLRQLQRDFKQILGRTPQDWLNEQRILAAREMLFGGTSIKRVAIELGYKQCSHFCRHFKNYSQLTPSQYMATGSKLDNAANG